MPDAIRHPALNAWIPAFAGMTPVYVFIRRVNNTITHRIEAAEERTMSTFLQLMG